MWKEIPGYANYMVSDDGRVYSKKLKREMKPSVSKFGYARVTLYDGTGEKHKIMVHRLVALAYMENPNDLPQVNHINENRLDNRVENLEWCSAAYNINFGSRNQRVSEKLTAAKEETVARMVEQIDPATKRVIKVWKSMRSIERELGYSHSNIYACCSGKRKTRGGYEWRYV